MQINRAVLFFLLVLARPAAATEGSASVGVYYFSGDEKKLSEAQVERAEDNQAFPAPLEPRRLARDFAGAELANGNVCLGQAERDLKAALKNKKITKMCQAIYRGEVADAARRARGIKKRLLRLECEAGVEARETPGAMSVVLAFRAVARVGDRVPEKLARAGIRNEPDSWTFSAFEAPIGRGTGWKEILKNRSCSLDSDALDEHFEAFLRQARAERALGRCRQQHADEAQTLSRLQERFRQYVPDEWMRDAAGNDLPALLSPVAGAEGLATLEACRAARKTAAEKMEELVDISESIASKYDVPALNAAAASAGRAPASVDQDDDGEND